MITITLSDEEAERLLVVLEDCMFIIEQQQGQDMVPVPLSGFHQLLRRKMRTVLGRRT